MMKTLYDLLGALAKDDAEDLRTAFRKAVKGAHPDLHPGDPNAALKFREIVRANEILGDAEQRAAYDHLLDLAHLEQVAASEQATAARFHRFASGMIAVAAVSVMAAGSYLLFMHVSAASLAPPDHTTPAILASPSVGPSTTGPSTSVAKEERAGIPREAAKPDAILSRANSRTIPADTGPARAEVAFARRNGNAIADLNPASLRPANLLDPKFLPADSSIIFYRLRRFDRAFADLSPAKQLERPDRARPASTTSGTPRFGAAAIARPLIPLPRRRPAAQDPSREESVASMRLR